MPLSRIEPGYVEKTTQNNISFETLTQLEAAKYYQDNISACNHIYACAFNTRLEEPDAFLISLNQKFAENNIIKLIYEGDVLVGYAFYRVLKSEQTLYESGIALTPLSQGKKLGSIALNNVLQQLADDDIEVKYLVGITQNPFVYLRYKAVSRHAQQNGIYGAELGITSSPDIQACVEAVLAHEGFDTQEVTRVVESNGVIKHRYKGHDPFIPMVLASEEIAPGVFLKNGVFNRHEHDGLMLIVRLESGVVV
mgnify:CR=1 FL=1